MSKFIGNQMTSYHHNGITKPIFSAKRVKFQRIGHRMRQPSSSVPMEYGAFFSTDESEKKKQKTQTNV